MSGQHQGAGGGRPTLLLVDDMVSNLDLLRSILADQDWAISVALSGQQAIDLMPRLRPDLILMDVVMPEMDGFETCRRIKALDVGADVPVIFLTAKTGEVELGFEAGGVDYLTKPLRRTEFLARLQTHLRLALLVKDMRARLLEREALAQLGDLVAEVTHEVGTPLGVGVTAASALKNAVQDLAEKLNAKTLSEPDLQSFMATAQEASELLGSNLSSAAALMDDLKTNAVDLASSRARNLRLRDQVDMTVRSLRPKLKQRLIDIHNRVPEDLQLQTQPGLLAKILRNLILNSLIHGFAQDERGEIDISARKLDDERFELIYRDTGRGIAPELHEEVLKRFFTTRPDAGGSGLGLDIIATACEQLGGQFKLESALGEGVEFRFDLPLVMGVRNQAEDS